MCQLQTLIYTLIVFCFKLLHRLSRRNTTRSIQHAISTQDTMQDGRYTTGSSSVLKIFCNTASEHGITDLNPSSAFAPPILTQVGIVTGRKRCFSRPQGSSRSDENPRTWSESLYSVAYALLPLTRFFCLRAFGIPTGIALLPGFRTMCCCRYGKRTTDPDRVAFVSLMSQCFDGRCSPLAEVHMSKFRFLFSERQKGRT